MYLPPSLRNSILPGPCLLLSDHIPLSPSPPWVMGNHYADVFVYHSFAFNFFLNNILFNFACFWHIYVCVYYVFVCDLIVFTQHWRICNSSLLTCVALLFIFPCMNTDTPHFIHPCSCWWAFGLFPTLFFGSLSHASGTILIHVFWCLHAKISLGYIPKGGIAGS